MPAQRVREHFIPFRHADLLRMCLSETGLGDAGASDFRRFDELLSSLFHFEFHGRLKALKDLYAPLDPDADTWPSPLPLAPAQDVDFMAQLRGLLAAANYREITRADLERALQEESLFRIRLQINFDDFEEVLFCRRGESRRREQVKRWFGLRQEEIEFTNYDRVFVYVRFREAAHFDGRPRAELPFSPGTSLLKLFQNVPQADLEMLFPNTQVRMKTLDKLLIGVPAAAGSIALIASKLGSTLLLLAAFVAFNMGLRAEPVSLNQATLVTLAAGMATLAGYVWRQLSKFKNRKIRFMKALTDNLYFKNLDNNAGVLHALIDGAEEEECKESLVAYHALLLSGEALSESELDQRIENWFARRWNCVLDFEVDDALTKLRRLELVSLEQGRYRAVPLDLALRTLDARWDGLFRAP